MLEILDEEFELQLEEIPFYNNNSIANWTQKTGYSII
jgi:hypothetical protein